MSVSIPAVLRVLFFVALLICSANRSWAQNYTWSVAAGGSWANGLNWGGTPGDFPNSATSRATFSGSANASPTTVTLDTAITLRRLIFNANQTGSVTIAPGTGGSLTFDDPETGQPSLNLIAGSGNHTIAANVTIQGPRVHRWNIAANQTLTVTGNISGTQGITLLGGGTLLLNGSNTYTGPTLVTGGTLGGSGSLASSVTTTSLVSPTTITAGTSSSAPGADTSERSDPWRSIFSDALR